MRNKYEYSDTGRVIVLDDNGQPFNETDRVQIHLVNGSVYKTQMFQVYETPSHEFFLEFVDEVGNILEENVKNIEKVCR